MLSVTALSSYIYCQRKLYLQKVLGIYEPVKGVMVKGSIRHETHEYVNNLEREIVESITAPCSLEDINQAYIEKYKYALRYILAKKRQELDRFKILPDALFRQALPLILEQAKTRAINVYNFMRLHKIYGKELWENLVPKIRSEVKIRSEAIGLSGVIDQLEIYPEGIVPLELKTGKSPNEGVWPGHLIQIGAYALLLEDHYKSIVEEGFVVYLDSNDRRHIHINSFLKTEVRELVEKVNTMLSSKAIPDFCGNDNKCSICGIREECHDTARLQKLMQSGQNS